MPHIDRLAALRTAMHLHRLDAYFHPHTDPHQSEYLCDHWQIMPWLTGFTGSAGTVVVTGDFAGVWTDSRYFLQAEEELAGTGFELVRLQVPHTPEYIGWLHDHLPTGARVGYDPRLMSLARYRHLAQALADKAVEWVAVADLPTGTWTDRPALPSAPVFEHDARYAGQSRTDKLAHLRTQMQTQGLDACLLTSLDDIAWLLNIRGSDVPYNPVALAFVWLDMEAVLLFVGAEKVAPSLRADLAAAGVELRPYDSLAAHLATLSPTQTVLADPSKLATYLFDALPAGVSLREGPHLTTALKAQKNDTELAHLRSTMIKDGVALVRLLYWLDQQLQGLAPITELSVEAQLEHFRQAQPDYVGPSFRTISAYQAHGAIVHYAATEASDMPLEPDGIFLLDSGGQYPDGTTDITRTIAIGSPTPTQCRDFTLVLKGHIALARAVFPAGTRAYQLDTLARSPLWQAGFNFGHGTGHGVGFFLSVHEGPQSIGSSASGNSTTVMLPGMVTSNEPGLYHAGRYGIRIENLVLCVLHTVSDAFGPFYAFETLSLCPIDLRLVQRDLLSPDERAWLNQYHAQVYARLAPQLSSGERAWLSTQTQPI
ncbi:MAG: aminopeptidase P family protein [Bacteroidia bacterium]